MSREWKPGDVLHHSIHGRGLVQLMDSGRLYVEFGDYAKARGSDLANVENAIRPLAVIDPEDREQVERLANAHLEARLVAGGHSGVSTRCNSAYVDSVQAALRSLTEPPKPDEPTAYLAAVADVEGNRWHISGGPVDGDRRWYSPDLNMTRAYRNIAAVKVLSEGVSS